MTRSRLGPLLARFLAERGMSQVAFAALVGVSQSFVSQVVLGRKRPSMTDAERWAEALGLDPVDHPIFLDEVAWSGADPRLWLWRERMEQRLAGVSSSGPQAMPKRAAEVDP